MLDMEESLHKRVLALERTALQHDKQIKAIRDLVREGMRMVIRFHAENRQLAASVRELTNSLKRGSNGHGKRKLDLH